MSALRWSARLRGRAGNPQQQRRGYQVPSAGQRLFYGWVVVGATFTVFITAYGFHFSYGVFWPEFAKQFGWSRGVASLPFAVYTMVYPLLSLLTGSLADRYGPRRIVFAAGLLWGLAALLLSRMSALWHLYAILIGVGALAMSATYIPATSTVVRWFNRRRGTAVGIISAGMSVGLVAVPPLAAQLVILSGWRMAYLVLAAPVALLIAAPALLLTRDPETRGLLPDGTPRDPATAAIPAPSGAPREPSLTLRQTVHTRAFWVLVLMLGVTFAFAFFPATHMAAYARDLGLSPRLAALAISAVGAGLIMGRAFSGVLADHLGERQTIFGCLVLEAAAFGGLALLPNMASMYAFGFLFGLGHGGVSGIFPALVGRLFGAASAGAVLGVVFALSAAPAGLGPYLGGVVFDVFGSYFWAFSLAALGNVLALVMLLFLRPPAAASYDVASP